MASPADGFYIFVDGTVCMHNPTFAGAQRDAYTVLSILPNKVVHIGEVKFRESFSKDTRKL